MSNVSIIIDFMPFARKRDDFNLTIFQENFTIFAGKFDNFCRKI